MGFTCTCNGKTFIWIWWVLMAIFHALYAALALNAFYSIRQGTGKLSDFKSDAIDFTTYKNGLLGAAFISFLTVLWAMIHTFLILIGRCFGDIKLAYGVMCGMLAHSAWIMLLSGLVLNTSQPLADFFVNHNVWTSNNGTAYRATWAFAYIHVIFFLLSFLILMFGRKALGRKELDSSSSLSSAGPSNSYVDMGAMSTPKTTTSFARNNLV